MRIALGAFSVAPDFYIGFIFYGILVVNCGIYVPFVGSSFITPSWEEAGLGRQLVFYYIPILFAALANIFLTMTLIGDPGIVTRKNQEPRDALQSVVGHDAPHQMALVNRGGHNVATAGGGASGAVSSGDERGLSHRDATQCTPQQRLDLERGEKLVAHKTMLAQEGADGVDCHFCPVCKVQVEMFDHHCVVIGACIGRYTMATFILFLYFAAALCFFGFFPALYRAFGNFYYWDWNKNPSEFLTIPHVVALLNVAAGFFGGGYTFWLGSHSLIFAYQGKNSLSRRRMWLRDNWDSIDNIERFGAHPAHGYLRKGTWTMVKHVFRDLKLWRLAPIAPIREI